MPSSKLDYLSKYMDGGKVAGEGESSSKKKDKKKKKRRRQVENVTVQDEDQDMAAMGEGAIANAERDLLDDASVDEDDPDGPVVVADTQEVSAVVSGTAGTAPRGQWQVLTAASKEKKDPHTAPRKRYDSSEDDEDKDTATKQTDMNKRQRYDSDQEEEEKTPVSARVAPTTAMPYRRGTGYDSSSEEDGKGQLKDSDQNEHKTRRRYDSDTSNHDDDDNKPTSTPKQRYDSDASSVQKEERGVDAIPSQCTTTTTQQRRRYDSSDGDGDHSPSDVGDEKPVKQEIKKEKEEGNRHRPAIATKKRRYDSDHSSVSSSPSDHKESSSRRKHKSQDRKRSKKHKKSKKRSRRHGQDRHHGEDDDDKEEDDGSEQDRKRSRKDKKHKKERKRHRHDRHPRHGGKRYRHDDDASASSQDEDNSGGRQRMSSGHRAGLQTGRGFAKAEAKIQDKRQSQAQEMVDKYGMGETIYRGSTKRDSNQLSPEEQAALNKGRVQKEKEARAKEDFARIQQAQFARRLDDEHVERMRKEALREGDPMAEYAMKRSKRKGGSKSQEDGGGSTTEARPVYRGPPAKPNRFGILPGHRWDGVDRGNGFEDRLLAQRYSQSHRQEQAYKWSSAGM